MKSIIVAASLLLPAVVHAQTSTSTELPASPADDSVKSSTYVAGGVMLGGEDGIGIIGAYTLEAGHQLRGSLWAHALVAKGAADGVDEVDDRDDGSYITGRVGLEERGCVVSAFCAVAGLDVGYRHGGFMDRPDVNDAVAVPRLGLDVGGRHMRFRPGIEVILDGANPTTIVSGLSLTAAIAYQL